MVYSRVALHASGAPTRGARASLDLDAAPYVSHISLPAHLTDGMDFAAASVRATSPDGLLLLDLGEARHLPPSPPGTRESLDRVLLLELAAAGAASEMDVARFVCNPLSGQLFRLPVPDMDVANASTDFGLLTQSDGSHGPPDRFVVAQLSCRAGDNRRVVRRFLSDTGEWDEDFLFVPSTIPGWPRLQIDTNRKILAFGGRLWWVDLTWGAFSVNPFCDRPELRFVELPEGSVLSDAELREKILPSKSRFMGTSEGKLRYIEVCDEREPFVISLFTLDDKGCCWELTGGHAVIAVDMVNGEVIGRRPFPDSITGLCPYYNAFFLPCLLPTWLESINLPCAGTFSRKKINRERKTLADILVRADRD